MHLFKQLELSWVNIRIAVWFTSTTTGSAEWVLVSATPSCPKALDPHVRTWPQSINAKVHKVNSSKSLWMYISCSTKHACSLDLVGNPCHVLHQEPSLFKGEVCTIKWALALRLTSPPPHCSPATDDIDDDTMMTSSMTASTVKWWGSHTAHLTFNKA